MAYPYKKMTSEDFDYIRSVTASDRVWVGDEIAKEYYRDEMPEYGVFPPELYVEVLNKEEISASWLTHIKKISRWYAVAQEPDLQAEQPVNMVGSCFL
mgnify:FL=1